MTNWAFYGRTQTLEVLDRLINEPRWFFCRIQGRRRIGKTTLLRRLAKDDESLLARMVYIQIPDSDERDVAASIRRALSSCESPIAQAAADPVTDFASIATAIGNLCRAGLFIVLDEFQYFTAAKLRPFNSFLQEQVDSLRDSANGGLFVLGSLQSEMRALLDDKGAPLFGRLTTTIDLQHWDFEDLLSVYQAHDLHNPSQWLTLWSFFEGVPKFYRDAYDQGLFSVPTQDFTRTLFERLFLKEGSPLAEEADTSFLREVKGKMLSILNFLAEHPGCGNGDLVAAVNRDDDTTPLGTHLKRLIDNYQMIDKRQPVFSDSKSRNARYYITDNFLQGWLSVIKPARDTSRMRPLAKAIELAMPRCYGHEGVSFEKLIRQLHIECSRKGRGDFDLTAIELGFWNRARSLDNDIEIDIVALSADDKRIRFGSCKRNPSAHDRTSLNKFDLHIERFLSTKEGVKLKDWTIEKVLFAPTFEKDQRSQLQQDNYQCRDLTDYARLLV